MIGTCHYCSRGNREVSACRCGHYVCSSLYCQKAAAAEIRRLEGVAGVVKGGLQKLGVLPPPKFE
jgi:hypothetical protein